MTRLKRNYVLAIAGAIAVIAAVVLVVMVFGEPRFEGRSLSHWLADPHVSEPDRRRAVRAIGTNAIPNFQEWLEGKPTWLETTVRRINGAQHQFQFDYTPQVDRQLAAMHGFFYLEELAQPADPWLKKKLEKRDDLFGFYAQAIVSSRGDGLDVVLAMYPGLSYTEQFQIVYAVFFSLKQQPELAETYRRFMNDLDPTIQSDAIQLLSELKQCPPSLLEELVALQGDPKLEPLAKSMHDHFTLPESEPVRSNQSQ
jgi:hypothetical protein